MKLLTILTLLITLTSHGKSGDYVSECLEYNDEAYCYAGEEGDPEYDRASPHEQKLYDECVTTDDEINYECDEHLKGY